MSFSNPFSKKVCPYCFRPFSIGDCKIFSSAQTDVSGEHLLLFDRPESVLARFKEQVFPRKLSHELFQQHQPYRRCPNPDCGKSLPYNITTNDSIVIGIVGGRASGKSHYIAALIETLQNRIPQKSLGIIELAPLPQVHPLYRREYYDPLFQRRTALELTPVGKTAEPLVYTVTSQERQPDETPRSFNLVIIDVSGEDLSDDSKMVRIAPFLLHARGFVLFVDPLVSDSFVAQLPPHLKPSIAPGERALVVLNNLVQNMRRYTGLPDGAVLPLPLVVTAAKGDLVRNVLSPRDPRTQALLGPDLRLPDADYRGGFLLDEYERFSAAAQVFLEQFDNASLVDRALSSFNNVSFSVVSATGSAYDDQLGMFRDQISPRRCADPVLWLLHQLGYIQSVTTV